MAKKEANIVIRLRDRASAGFQSLTGRVKGLLTPLGLATTALGALGGVLAGFGLRAAIREAGDFGEQMSIVGGITQATGDDFKALSDAAREAGATTRFTATEAGQGLEELARGGLSASQAINTLNPVLDLAAGNNQTVAESAQQAITAINAFGLEAEDSQRVADVYTRAAQRSAQTTAELAAAMQFAAPVARQAGLSIEETAALVGKLADQGFRGSMGGTALRNALIDLQTPSSKFRQELQELGITSTDFVEVLDELAQQGDKSDAALQALGKRAGPAIQALVQGGSAGLRELIGELQDSEGAANDAAAAMEDNLPGALRSLKSAFANLQIEAVSDLTDKLKDSVFDLADGMREFADSPAMGELKELLVDLFEAGRRTVEEFIEAVDFEEIQARVVEFSRVVRERFGDLVVTADNFRRGFQIAFGAVQSIVGIVQGAFSALGLVIARVIDGALAGAQLLLKGFNTLTFGVVKSAKRVQEEIEGVRMSLDESIEGFEDGLLAGAEKIGDGWNKIADTNQKGAKKSADGVTEELKKQTDAITAEMEELQLASAETVAALDELDKAGRKSADGMDTATESTRKTSEALDELPEKAAKAKDAIGLIDGEWVRLKGSAKDAADAQKDATDALEDQADKTDTLGESTSRQTRRTQDLADSQAELKEQTDETARSARGLGGSIEMGAVAQERFNRAMLEWKGGGTATYINHFKRSLEEALEVQRRIEAAQSRINALQAQGVDVTDDFVAANRGLREELMLIRGEEEKLADLRRREQEEALQAQLALAQAEGDDERIKQIREHMQLQRDLARERERQEREERMTSRAREQELDKELEVAREMSRARGGPTTRETKVVVEFRAAVEEGGITLSERERQRLVTAVLDSIDLDRGRA